MDAGDYPRKDSAISTSTTIAAGDDLPSLTSVPKFSEKETASQPDATIAVVGLWSEAVARYCHNLSFNDNNRPDFMDQAPRVIDHFHAAFDQWTQFRSQTKPGKMSMRIGRIMQVLQDKISTIDVLIGYPTQAVLCLLF